MGDHIRFFWQSCSGPLVSSSQRLLEYWLEHVLAFSVPDEGYCKKARTNFDIYVFIMT
jgi:hypothetical protein